MFCTPLDDAPFGARLHLDPERPLDASARDGLRAAIAEHGLLVVREGPITRERQIALLAALGRIEPDETGAPMQMEVTNQHAETTAPPGELVFHNDYAYDPDPIPGISMYASLVEGEVTPTCFASASRVLARLPADLVDRLRGLEASHACFLARPDGSGERAIRPEPLVPRGEPGWGPEHYWATHPVVVRNAAGVEALFVCLQHTDRILGLPREESDALLARLYAELYAADRVYAHRWRPHDLVIWDNLAVQHARPAPNDRPRTLRRFHLANRDLTADYLRIARERGFV